MKRRDFLKKLGIVCGAAIACPAALLKGEPEWMKYARYFNAHNGKKTLDAMRGRSITVIYYDEFVKPNGYVSFRGTSIPYLKKLPI